MPLFYRKYKNNNSQSEGYGKWYGRPVIVETVEIDAIAQRMQDSCTVKKSDVKAVLEELGPTIKLLLQDSKRVRIPSLGCFKLSMSTLGEADKEKFSAASNIKKVKVLFQPETEEVIINGKRRRTYRLTEGVSIVELPSFDDTEQTPSGGGGGGEG